MTSETESLTASTEKGATDFLAVLLLVAGLAFFWLLAGQGQKGGVTPYGWGEHALAMKRMAESAGTLPTPGLKPHQRPQEAFPYSGGLLITDGFLQYYLGLPVYTMTQRAGLAIWGLTLQSRLMLSLTALMLFACLGLAKVGLWPRRLIPLAFLVHPQALELAMAFNGVPEAMLFLTVAFYGLLSGKGMWTGLGVVLAVACRDLVFPHGVLICFAFVALHPKQWGRMAGSVALFTVLVFGPVWLKNGLQWYILAFWLHFQKLLNQPNLLATISTATLASLGALAGLAMAWTGFLQAKRLAGPPVDESKGRVEARAYIGLVVGFLIGPALLFLLCSLGAEVYDYLFAPAALFTGLGALVLWQRRPALGVQEKPASSTLALAGMGAMLALHLGLAAQRNSFSWVKPLRTKEIVQALSKERPGGTIYGDQDLLAQVVHEIPKFQLWKNMTTSHPKLMLSDILPSNLFFGSMTSFPPDYLVVQRDSGLTLFGWKPFQQILKKHYGTLAGNKIKTLVVFKSVKIY